MRHHTELTEARRLLELMLAMRGPRGGMVAPPEVLRGQIQVLDWVMHKKFDAFAVRLLAAKMERPQAHFTKPHGSIKATGFTFTRKHLKAAYVPN